MKVVALSGGVGGARFARGLASVLPSSDVTIIVNTGDDFEHWGLNVCPDIDTVLYSLAGLSPEDRGWGVADDTVHALAAMRRLGEEDWFALGDADLAMHLARTRRLRQGQRLCAITRQLARALGVAVDVVPMADQPRATWISTRDEGDMPFQHWFVRRRAVPQVRAIRFQGSSEACPEALAALRAADLVLLGPSNPYVSIDPILSLSGMLEAAFARPVIAISPIVHGLAIKGPLAEMVRSIDAEAPGPAAIARHYSRLAGRALDGMMVEVGDEVAGEATGIPVLATRTVMKSLDDSRRLAAETLAFARGR